MSGTKPPDESKIPENTEDKAIVITPVVQAEPTDEATKATITKVTSTVSAQTRTVSPDQLEVPLNVDIQTPPLDQVPILDLRKLNRAVIEFLIKLKINLPTEKAESIDEAKDQLKMTMVEIGMMAEELRKLHATLTPEQSQKLSEVVDSVPQADPVLEDFLTKSQIYWAEHLKTVIDFLTQLQAEGMGVIGKVDENGLQVNRPYLNKLNGLLMNMVKSFMEFSKEAYKTFLEINEKKRIEQMKIDHMNRISTQENFRGINTEDIADTEVDKTLYEELITHLSSDKPAKEVVHSLVAAIAINFLHLKNSLAAQNGTVIGSYISDLEDGIPERNLYDKNSPDHSFKDEALAAMHLLTILNRCLSGVLNSQKLADLIRQVKK